MSILELNLPIHVAWLSSIFINESAAFNCGKTTALKPNVNPVFIVPKFATNAAKTCLKAFPRSFLFGCISTIAGEDNWLFDSDFTMVPGFAPTRFNESCLKEINKKNLLNYCGNEMIKYAVRMYMR